ASRRRHTRCLSDWSSDVCSSDLKFKCDVHQWMTGFVWVQNTPYFAVTKDDGSFDIKGVPAGKYEIEAWHERFGTKKGEVTVSAEIGRASCREGGEVADGCVCYVQ